MMIYDGGCRCAIFVRVCVWGECERAQQRRLIARTARLLLSLLLHCVAQTESEPYARESVAYECNKRSSFGANTLYPSTKHDNNERKNTEGKICFHDYFFSIAFCKRLCGSGGVGGGNGVAVILLCVWPPRLVCTIMISFCFDITHCEPDV